MVAAEKKDVVYSGDDTEPDKKDHTLENRHRNPEFQEFDEGDGCSPVFCVLDDDDDDVACSTQYRQVSGNGAPCCKCKERSISCTRLKEHWNEQSNERDVRYDLASMMPQMGSLTLSTWRKAIATITAARIRVALSVIRIAPA